MKMTFLRDTELLITSNPFGLNDLYFEKGEEAQVSKYSEYEIGKDMWSVSLIDGTEFFVMKEDVEISS